MPTASMTSSPFHGLDAPLSHLEEKREIDSERYAMLKDLHDRIEQIREIRKKRCRI